MRKLEYKKVKRIDNSKCETEQILMTKVSDAPFRWAVLIRLSMTFQWVSKRPTFE